MLMFTPPATLPMFKSSTPLPDIPDTRPKLLVSEKLPSIELTKIPSSPPVIEPPNELLMVTSEPVTSDT